MKARQITGVKKVFEQTKKKYEVELAVARGEESPADIAASGFPFATGAPPMREELMALLPREEIAGACIDAYFRNYDAIFRGFFPVSKRKRSLLIGGKNRCPPPSDVL